MEAFLYLGGVAGILGAVLGLVAGTSLRRTLALLALGVALAFALVLFAYLSAPTDSRESNCSDCGMYLGRWWEPWFVGFIAVANLLAWAAAVIVAASLRTIASRARTAPHAG